jgi:hypothetical protein
MEAGGCHLSASLCTMEFHLDGSGTHLRLTEQLAYLDGRYDLGERICRTGEGPQPTRAWRLVLEVMENLHSVKH